MRGLAALYLVLWIAAIGWQANNVWRAWRAWRIAESRDIRSRWEHGAIVRRSREH